MTVSEIFGISCQGPVFDAPCPHSFVPGETFTVAFQVYPDRWQAKM